MTAVSLRRLAVAGLLATAVLAVSACGAGQISQTAVQVPAVNGNQANAGKIALRDVRIDFPSARGAVANDYDNKKNGKAVLLFSAINTSPHIPDTLTEISTPVGKVHIVPAEPGNANPELQPQKPLIAGHAPTEAAIDAQVTDPAKEPILVELTNLNQDLIPGLTTEVTFTFAKNGSVKVAVPIDAGPDSKRHQSEKSGTESSAEAEHGGH